MADADRSLAIERTALAWNRTALGHAVVGALALRVVANDTAALVAAPAFASALIAWIYGARRVATTRRLPPAWCVAAVAAGTALTAVSVAVAWATTA